MSIRRLADRDIRLDGDCDQCDEDQTQHLVLVLRELLDRLSRQIRGGPTAILKDVERWEGGGISMSRRFSRLRLFPRST